MSKFSNSKEYNLNFMHLNADFKIFPEQNLKIIFLKQHFYMHKTDARVSLLEIINNFLYSCTCRR